MSKDKARSNGNETEGQSEERLTEAGIAELATLPKPRRVVLFGQDVSNQEIADTLNEMMRPTKH